MNERVPGQVKGGGPVLNGATAKGDFNSGKIDHGE